MSHKHKCLWLVACTMWVSVLPAPAQAAEPFLMGIGMSIHYPEHAPDRLTSLGVRSMRIDATWSEIEKAPGQYRIPQWLDAAVDSAVGAGIQPILILAYGNRLYGGDKPCTSAARSAFARYARFVVSYFNGRVRHFDLWNEWNTTTGRTAAGSPADYVALAQAVYPAIKAANPNALLATGGITSRGFADGWYEAFISHHGLRYFDALSIHPYTYQSSADPSPEAALAIVDRAYARADSYGRPLPVLITEMGYPTHVGRGGVSETTAAEYLARFALLASTRPYVAGVWWYTLRDRSFEGRNKEHHFGVLDAGLGDKPAAQALRSVAPLFNRFGRFSDTSTIGQSQVTAIDITGAQMRLTWNRKSTIDTVLADLRRVPTTSTPIDTNAAQSGTRPPVSKTPRAIALPETRGSRR